MFYNTRQKLELLQNKKKYILYLDSSYPKKQNKCIDWMTSKPINNQLQLQRGGHLGIRVGVVTNHHPNPEQNIRIFSWFENSFCFCWLSVGLTTQTTAKFCCFCLRSGSDAPTKLVYIQSQPPPLIDIVWYCNKCFFLECWFCVQNTGKWWVSIWFVFVLFRPEENSSFFPVWCCGTL